MAFQTATNHELNTQTFKFSQYIIQKYICFKVATNSFNLGDNSHFNIDEMFREYLAY